MTIDLTGHDVPMSYTVVTDASGNATINPMEAGDFYILADFATATNTPPGFTIAYGEINGGWVRSLGEDQDKLGMNIYVSAVDSTSVDIELFD